MVKQSDAFDRAAQCQQLMDLETEEIQKTAYRSLRDKWIGLANEDGLMSPVEFTRQFVELDQIQFRFQNSKKAPNPAAALSAARTGRSGDRKRDGPAGNRDEWQEEGPARS